MSNIAGNNMFELRKQLLT